MTEADPTPDSQLPARNPPHAPDLRVGHGYDLHRLEHLAPDGPGKPLIIGGVCLDHDRGPLAHSDGDVLYHAVTDALLGAIAHPDIGQLFPDSDQREAGRDSSEYVARAAELVRERGYRPISLDATVVLERPKIGPHKDAMRGNIARLLGMDAEMVNVKGKTHEAVDAVGQGLALEAHCVVLLSR